MTELPKEIFKAYDIRGIVGRTLTVEGVELIGRALASMALEQGLSRIAVGRDGRLSGPELLGALAAGMAAAGVEVIDLGLVTTPITYFAAHHLGTGCAVMVTGSHNPPEYNGLKMVIGQQTLAGEAIQALRRRIAEGDLKSGEGRIVQQNIVEAYLDRIVGDVRLARPVAIGVDCGNGAAGPVAKVLFERLGATVVPLFCEVDGHFPNHHPDPSQPKNLQTLIDTVMAQDLELGLAFDGDGDRLGVVTRDGQIIYPDRQLMLFAADLLERKPGAKIIFDVKCTRNLAPWIEQHGGEPIMGRTGHSLIKGLMKETGAELAGEMSGHVFFKERWFGFDDGVYAGARLLEIVSRHADGSTLLEALPDSVSTPEINLKTAEGENVELVAKLSAQGSFPGGRIVTVDGIRVEYPDGFGLARPSNTTPVVVLRFEGDTPEALDRIRDTFRQEIARIAPGAEIPF